jgi:hypothetical protein
VVQIPGFTSVDATGTRLVTPTDELERLGWCGPARDVFAPHGIWSPNGRSLVITCQTEAEALTTTILDLDQRQWIGIKNTGRWLVSPAVGDPRPLGEDHLSAEWVHVDEQLAITHYRIRWDTDEEFVSVYLFSLDDHTLRRIADFDGQSSTWSLRVAPDQRQIGMVARRADDPAASVYVWEEGAPLRQFPGVHDNPFSAIPPLFVRIMDVIGGKTSPPAAIAPNGQWLALKVPTGWQLYAANGSAGGLVPESPPFRSHQAAWSNDSTRWWICQVEEGVGGHLLEVDRQGQVQERAFYPNVAFASVHAPCVIESAQGRYAIGLSNGLVVITDADYRELGSVPGTTQGWRPHR